MFKVLIIDDSETIRLQLAEMVDSIDRTVVMATNGKEGMERLKAEPDIGMIFCDVNMPVMDGIDFLETLSKLVKARILSSRPIIILTTESEMEKVLRAKKAGIDGWLIKPPKKESIERIVAKFSQMKSVA